MPFVSSIRKKHNKENSHENPFEVTGGDVVYTAGGYKIHMFTQTGDSALNVAYKSGINSTAMSLASTVLDAEILVVGGGGSAGSRHGGGGGGGGMVTSNGARLTVGNYSTSVGSGGGQKVGDVAGDKGQDSVFGSITAIGGGGGGNWGPASPTSPRGGGQGGSGGGSGGHDASPGQSQQPIDQAYDGLGHGYPGGWLDRFQNAGPIRAGGGGGAGGKGFDGNKLLPRAGDGGQGKASSILGTNYFWAGGGGGGVWDGPVGGYGGKGGGGAGAGTGTAYGGRQALNNGQNAGGYPGTATGTVGGQAGTNTGSGGGGANQTPSTSGAGGPGIVVVRYKI